MTTTWGTVLAKWGTWQNALDAAADASVPADWAFLASAALEGGSECLVAVATQGAGKIAASGGAEAVVEVATEGDGVPKPSSGSEADIGVATTGAGSPRMTGGSQTPINVVEESNGSPSVAGGSESVVEVETIGAGVILVYSGSEALLLVVTTGDGRVRLPPKGPTTVTINDEVTGAEVFVLLTEAETTTDVTSVVLLSDGISTVTDVRDDVVTVEVAEYITSVTIPDSTTTVDVEGD